MRTLKTLIGIIFICCMFVFPGIAEGTVVSECKILDSETIINSANTTAYVDTINHEIRLPEAGSFRKISFAGESYDYVVLTEDSAIHYSFNGEEMVENPIASVNNLVNPLSVFSAAYPDVIVSTKTQVTHYSFTGTDMTENPALSIAANNIKNTTNERIRNSITEVPLFKNRLTLHLLPCLSFCCAGILFPASRHCISRPL
jgi:hypothetical protein